MAPKKTITMIRYLRRQSFTAQIVGSVVALAAIVFAVVIIVISNTVDTVAETPGGIGAASEVAGSDDLLLTELAVAAVALTVLALLCWWATARCLRPLGLLASSAHRIAGGNIGEDVPVTSRPDELGQLQNAFAGMQRSLVSNIRELKHRREYLNRQNTELQRTFDQARQLGNVRSDFLNRMKDQMAEAVDDISALNDTLCDRYGELSKTEVMKIHIQMLAHTDTVTHLLDQMLKH